MGGNGSFGFTITGEENDVETERTIVTAGGTGTATVALVPGVQYTVREMNLGSGWTMGDFSCTLNGKAMSIPFTVGPDADITCAVTNTAKGKTQAATVIIDKETVPEADSAVFDFQWFLPNSEFGEAFTLTDTQEPKVFAGPNPDQDWGITEMAEDGWRFLGLECLKGGEPFDGTTADGTEAILNPAPGDVITCTYTNGKRGPVDISKTVTSGPDLNADSTYTVTYSIRVSSESFVTEQYNLWTR